MILELIRDLGRRLRGRSAEPSRRVIDCQDGEAIIEPSPFFDGRLALTVRPDLPIVPAYLEQPLILNPDEARAVAAGLIGGAQEVERDG